MIEVASSVPTLTQFDPYRVPYQIKVISLIRQEYNYQLGPLEILLSGSVGSAKSLLIAHIIATHAIFFPGAGVLVGRRVHRDMKNTIWAMMLKHYPEFKQYWNRSDTTIRMPNGSVIYGVSWDKGDYDKFRSYELSLAVIEELTENETIDMIHEIKMRLGRAQGVRENLLICATNPDSPNHPAHEYFIDKASESRRVFYSTTEDNPFLPKWYIESLKKTLDPKMAQRMLYGKWVEISKENVYYAYEQARNFRESYQISPAHPIHIAHDFNVGHQKPMSTALGQRINGIWHWFKAYHVEGARTLNIMEEMANDGVFEHRTKFIINGDATGRSRDTRSIKTDYDIIEEFLANYKTKDGRRLDYEIDVPRSNPPVRTRHNMINAGFINASGRVTMYVYDKWIDKGFRLTAFQKGSIHLEDDSLPEQHVTTAIGYAVYRASLDDDNESSSTIL